MAPEKKDLIGQRFKRLVVIAELPREERAKPGEKSRYKNRKFLCLCDCGNTTTCWYPNLQRGVSGSCGCLKQGPTNWKAKERYHNADGYALLKKPEHPRANKHTGMVREHIVVMEAKLGRFLLPGEEVHHLNGVRDDNRLENLELWTRSQPAGSRVEDKVKWAIELLTEYAPRHLLNTTP